MGSFNFTCAVSGLPIRMGEPVRFVLLQTWPFQDKAAHQACYPHEWWCLRNYALMSTYNEGGLIDTENVHPKVLRDLWMYQFQQDLIEVSKGSRSHEPGTKKGMSFKDLLESLWEGRVSVTQPPEEPEPGTVKKRGSKKRTKGLSVSCAMIREDVWEEMLKLKMPEYPSARVSDYVKQVRAIVKRVASTLGKRDRFWASMEMRIRHQGTKNHVLPDALEETRRLQWIDLADLLCNGEIARKDFLEVTQTMGEQIWIEHLLGHMDFRWKPSTVAAQCPSYELHWRWRESLSGIAAGLCEQEDEEGYWEADEEGYWEADEEDDAS